MKTCEILWELPTCDIETWTHQMLLENGTDKSAQSRVATNLPLWKAQWLWSTVSWNTIKWGIPYCSYRRC